MKKKINCSKEKTVLKIPTGSEYDFTISFIKEKEQPVVEEKKKEIDIEDRVKKTLHKFDVIQLEGSFPQRSFKKEKKLKNEKKLHIVNFGSSEQKYAKRGSYIGTETRNSQRKTTADKIFQLNEKIKLQSYRKIDVDPAPTLKGLSLEDL